MTEVKPWRVYVSLGYFLLLPFVAGTLSAYAPNWVFVASLFPGIPLWVGSFLVIAGPNKASKK